MYSRTVSSGTPVGFMTHPSAFSRRAFWLCSGPSTHVGATRENCTLCCAPLQPAPPVLHCTCASLVLLRRLAVRCSPCHRSRDGVALLTGDVTIVRRPRDRACNNLPSATVWGARHADDTGRQVVGTAIGVTRPQQTRSMWRAPTKTLKSGRRPLTVASGGCERRTGMMQNRSPSCPIPPLRRLPPLLLPVLL